MKDIEWIKEKFIAHRGLHNDKIPRYSLQSFENAIEHGYAIELDVRPCLDGVAIAHNPTFMEGDKEIQVASLKESELKNYKLGPNYSPMCSLNEVFNLVKGQTPIFIDIKQDKTKVGEFEQKLATLIKDYMKKYNGKIAIIAFNPFTIKWFKKNAPEIPRGFLTTIWKKDMEGCPKSALTRFILSHNLLYKRGDADFLDINVDDLPKKNLKKFPNMPILGWTICSQECFDEKAKYLDNITFEGFIPVKK